MPQMQWDALVWMLALAGLGTAAWNRLFAPRMPGMPGLPRMEWRWAALLCALALAPVLPALRAGWVYGPFDTNVPLLPWAGEEDRAYRPKMGRLNDVTLQILPWQVEARRQLLAGRVPLLNPCSGAGLALLGNGQSAPVSFFSLASLPFPPLRAQALRGFLAVGLALAGTFLAARQLGCRPAFALLAAVAYGFGGSLSVWKLFPLTEVMALWPFAFLAGERLLASPGERSSAVLLSSALAGMCLAGHPETAVAGGLALAGRWLGALVAGRGRALLQPAAIALLAVLSTAFFLFPLAETVAGSARLAREGDGGAARGAGLGGVATLAVPGLFGTPQNAGEAGPGPLQWLGEGAVGVAPVLLALVALRRLRGAPAYLAVLAAAAFAIHLGLFAPLFRLPVLSVFATRYFAYLGGFAVALLAAWALEAWQGSRWGLAAGLAAAGAAAAAHGLARLRWQGMAVDPAIVAESGRLALLAGVTALGVGLALRLRGRRPGTAGLLVSALTAAQLAAAFGGYTPTVPARHAYPDLPLVTALHRESGPFRVIGTRGVLFPNSSTVYALADVRGHDPTLPARYAQFLATALDVDPLAYKKQYRTPQRRHIPYLRLLGVRFLLSGPELRLERPWIDRGLYRRTRLWELDGPVQWAFFPPTVVPVASPQRARQVMLAAGRPLRPLQVAAIEVAGDETTVVNGKARVLAAEVAGGRLRFLTEVQADSWLVIAQSAIPGWRAWADGKAVRTAVADGALLAVSVPRGTREVRLRYLPRSFTIGLAVSLLTWLAVFFLLSRELGPERR